MIEAFPLYWPDYYPRTENPQRSRFDCVFAYTRDMLLDEIRLLGGSDIIISTDIPLRQDGLPKANRREPDDKGVAVYFIYEGNQMVFACDQWDRIRDNVHAIRKTINALRGINRWGVSEMLSRVFSGFKTLPEGTGEIIGTKLAWWPLLECEETATADEIKAAYRKQVKRYHPDNKTTGDPIKFAQIKWAYEQGLKANK